MTRIPPHVAAAASTSPHEATSAPTRVRYVVLAMIFLITTLNYADRATLSVTGPAMRAEYGFGAVQMGYLFSAFSWAYVLAQIPGGWLLDRFGPRRVYACSIFAWSLFTLMQAVSSWGALISGSLTAVTTLFALRFAVGLAESPAFPANAKIVASWFPTAERGTASAVFNSAQYFAAMAFTPLMAAITHWFGWRAVYVAMGSIGFVFALVWVRFMRSPARHPSVNRAELQHIADGGGLIDMGEVAAPPLQSRTIGEGRTAFYLKRLLSNRMLMGVYIGQFSINVLTYFFLTWFPVYLVQQRHMSILKAGFMASVPALCGFAGGVLGGLLSDALLKAGWSLTAARKLPIIGGMLLSVSLIVCNYVDSEWLVVGLMALAFFGKGVGSLGWAVVADTAPREVVGLAGSIFNMFGNAAGIVTPVVIGYIVESTGSFNLALVFVGLNALVTVLSYALVVGKIQRIEFHSIPT
jgi:ACS family glucarate transporter-like MFS transporter